MNKVGRCVIGFKIEKENNLLLKILLLSSVKMIDISYKTSVYNPEKIIIK